MLDRWTRGWGQRGVLVCALAVLAGVILLALGQLAPPVVPGAAAVPIPASGPATVPASGFLRDYQSLQTELQPLPWWSLAGDVAFKLLFVLGLFFFAIRLLKPLASGGGTAAQRASVTVLGTTSLGPQRQLYLLEVGGKVVLVGATSQQLTALTEITDAEAIEQLRAAQRAQNLPFADQLSGLVDQWAPQLLREQFRDGQGTVRARLAEWRRVARGGGASG